MTEGNISHQNGFGHLTDLPCLKLQFGEASAVISLYGGQLLSYKPTAQRELLWLSPLATWHQHMPIRGGIPVCWPWFGAADAKLNPQRQTLPNHGLVRTRLWRVTSMETDQHGVSVKLAVDVNDLPHCSGSATLQLQLSLADKLSISVHCNNQMLQQAALHSYFNVANLFQTQVQPLPLRYLDKVTASTVMTNSVVADFTAEVDRIYLQPDAALQISDSHSVIQLNQAGQDATVVWNPWQAKCAQIADLAAGSYLEFICVETASLQLEQAAPLNIVQQISVL
jgi:glucose-6-phosphate 1-epimerase